MLGTAADSLSLDVNARLMKLYLRQGFLFSSLLLHTPCGDTAEDSEARYSVLFDGLLRFLSDLVKARLIRLRFDCFFCSMSLVFWGF